MILENTNLRNIDKDRIYEKTKNGFEDSTQNFKSKSVVNKIITQSKDNNKSYSAIKIPVL